MIDYIEEAESQGAKLRYDPERKSWRVTDMPWTVFWYADFATKRVAAEAYLVHLKREKRRKTDDD